MRHSKIILPFWFRNFICNKVLPWCISSTLLNPTRSLCSSSFFLISDFFNIIATLVHCICKYSWFCKWDITKNLVGLSITLTKSSNISNNWSLLSFTILISSENLNNFSSLNSTRIAIYQITANSNTQHTTTYAKTTFYTKKPNMFPKIVIKTVYIRQKIKLFRFHMNPKKPFPLWITYSFCSFSSNFDLNLKQF